MEFKSTREGCVSAAGNVGGKQFINLGPGCFKLDIIVALIEKTLGFLDDAKNTEITNTNAISNMDPYQRGFFDWVLFFSLYSTYH